MYNYHQKYFLRRSNTSSTPALASILTSFPISSYFFTIGSVCSTYVVNRFMTVSTLSSFLPLEPNRFSRTSFLSVFPYLWTIEEEHELHISDVVHHLVPSLLVIFIPREPINQELLLLEGCPFLTAQPASSIAFLSSPHVISTYLSSLPLTGTIFPSLMIFSMSSAVYDPESLSFLNKSPADK